MKVKFCGAAQTVTGSCHLLTLDSGFTILLDTGLYQGRDDTFEGFNEEWLFDPKKIDCMILSHAHIDHSGRIPKLVRDGFRGKIYSTSATKDLAAVMLVDSAKIQEKDAKFINKQRKKRGEPQDAKPLYNYSDAVEAMRSFVGVSYDRWCRINDEVSFIFKDSGHIFGSASVTLKIEREGQEPVMFGFTGDIGRKHRPILKDPDPMPPLDYLICESTYGGRTHESQPRNKAELLEIVRETCVEREGKLLIPAFSVGRTQEIVYMLDQLESDGRLPKIPVFVDSPMAINATDIFQLHPECFDEEISNYMRRDPNPFGFNKLTYVRRTHQSKKLNHFRGPCIIISASGMMNGGRIIHHLINHIEDERNTLLIVGYCAPHTIGYRLRNGADKIRLYGQEKNVYAKVVILDGFSGHGDQNEMLDYLSSQDKKRLKNIFLVHGEKECQEAFKEGLLTEGYQKVYIPELGEEVILD